MSIPQAIPAAKYRITNCKTVIPSFRELMILVNLKSHLYVCDGCRNWGRVCLNKLTLPEAILAMYISILM